jgi:hypothetical protein
MKAGWNCASWLRRKKDPKKLIALIGEIDRLLESKEQRVTKAPNSVTENSAKKAS